MKNTILLGDSITQWNPLKERCLVNMGEAGDTTRDIFWRIEEVKAIEAEKVIFMAGINDILMGFSKEKTLDFYKKIVLSLKESFEEIIILSVLPTEEGERVNAKVRELNRGIEEMAKENKLIFLDLYPIFCDENNTLKSVYSTDGLHLSSMGYETLNLEIIKLF
jgi:lysophospholipase L1-like esterase